MNNYHTYQDCTLPSAVLISNQNTKQNAGSDTKEISALKIEGIRDSFCS